MIYNKITEFCSVRNIGNCFKNGSEPTPRVKFIINLLEEEGIEYEIDAFEEERQLYKPRPRKRGRFKYLNDKWWKDIDVDEDEIQEPEVEKNIFYNIIMRGTSDKMIIAHHDVNNHTTDNANDNSCSVINVIATKKLKPSVNAVLVDGEEFGGIGSNRLGKQIVAGDFGSISWVLNYELTGKGGKYFFIGDYPGELSNLIVKKFNCPIFDTPFNDSVTLRRYGIDSTVINPLPPLPDGRKSGIRFNDGKYLDHSMLHNCHSPKDSLSSISIPDMKEFVEEVVLKILQ